MEPGPRADTESRPRKSKTKGILKNGGGGSRETGSESGGRGERRQKERRSAEIRVEPEKKHRHRRHRDSNIYDTPKGKSTNPSHQVKLMAFSTGYRFFCVGKLDRVLGQCLCTCYLQHRNSIIEYNEQ